MDYHALERMTVVQLRDEAKKYPDIKGLTGMKKEELITAVAGELGLEQPKPSAKKQKKSKALPLDKGTLKKKIVELKEQGEKARAAKNKKEVVLLRRRIHSLKRRLRKVA